jgi:hypothetical protein
MEGLESRLGTEDLPGVKEAVIFDLASRRYEAAASTSNPYFKYNLIPRIVDMINNYAPTEKGFVANLNSTLNKDEAKRVYYGLVAMGHPSNELKRVLSKLDDWEKVYFFAGVWKNRSMYAVSGKSLSELVEGYIKTGVDFLHKSHMIKKAQGTYKRKLKLPESQDYRKN